MTMYQQAPPPYYPPSRPKNGLGTTSLVMGILSIVFAWIPFVGLSAYAMSITGIITGVVGRGRVRSGVATNGGASVGGVVTSIIGLVSVVLATVVYSSLMYAVATSEPNTVPTTLPSEASTTEPATSKASKPAEKTAKVGDTVVDGSFAYTVKKVRTGVRHVGDSTFGETAQGQFVIVNVTVRNVGDEAVSFHTDDAYLFDDKGRRYDADTEANITIDYDNWLEEINPGNTMKGKIVFDIPKKVEPVSLELNNFLGGDGGATFSLR